MGFALSSKASKTWESVWPITICVSSKGCKIILVTSHFDSKREDSVFKKFRSSFCKKHSKNIQTSPSQANKRRFYCEQPGLQLFLAPRPEAAMWCAVQVTEQDSRPKGNRALLHVTCSMRKPRIYWKSFIMVRCFLCLVSEADRRDIKRVWTMGLRLASCWRGFQSSSYAANPLRFLIPPVVADVHNHHIHSAGHHG